MHCVRDLLVRASPASAAIHGIDGSAISYSSLLEIIGRQLEFLNGAGIGRGDRIAILTTNGPGAAVAFLGAACAAAAAPLNPAYRAREIEFYLSDLRPKALIIEEGIDSPAVDVARGFGMAVFRFEQRTFALRGELTNESPVRLGWAQPDDTALLLHTSGTTSRPKLVPLTHRNLCASAANVARTLQLTPSDRCLNIMPLFHIHGLVGAVLSSLAAGASITCAPNLIVTRFFDWLEQSESTWYTAVPTMHQSILARFRPCKHRLRLIRSSSSALPPQVMADVERAFGVPVVESYGMTEASHQVASNPLPPGVRKPGSVGRPAGPEVSILDGEVVIRGDTVTSGYEANPEANAAAFLDGWFRTGDQGYLDAGGYLFLTGRIKELINRGGEKIAPREIDEALLEHPSIQQAVAFAVPDERLGEDIGVAVVPKNGVALAEREVIEFAALRLADFKVPRVVRIVTEIPMGPTGKLQRIGLAKTLGIQTSATARPVTGSNTMPRSESEARLQGVWSEVMRIAPPGIDDDFFALGGESLQAAQIASRIEQEFGVRLPLVVFRTSPTISGMAEALEQLRRAESHGIADGLVAIRPGDGGVPLFCISGHRGGLLGFSNLSHHLPATNPVLAFEPPTSGEVETVEALAQRYLKVMRAQQPDGPYLLLGHCFGGFVAYEMACRLQQAGDEVALLAMVECFNQRWLARLGTAGRTLVRARHFMRRLGFHWTQAIRADSIAAYLRNRSHVVRNEHRERVMQAAYEIAILEGRVELAAQSIANRAAGARYEPGPYAGRTLLIAPAHPRARRYLAPLLGWRELLTGVVDYVEVSDGLSGLLAEPAATAVASAVAASMRNIDEIA